MFTALLKYLQGVHEFNEDHADMSITICALQRQSATWKELVPEDRRNNINEENQRRRRKWMEDDLSTIWEGLLTSLMSMEERFPMDGDDIPLKEMFYEHQRDLIAVLFMEWCGVRREIISMQTTSNLRFDDQGVLVFKPPPEKISQSAGREFPVPQGETVLLSYVCSAHAQLPVAPKISYILPDQAGCHRCMVEYKGCSSFSSMHYQVLRRGHSRRIEWEVQGEPVGGTNHHVRLLTLSVHSYRVEEAVHC